MDFKKIKEKALEAKNALVKQADKAVSFSRDKVVNAALIKEIKYLDEFIAKTANYTSSTGKEVVKIGILLVIDTESDFYKKLLYVFPTLYTKGWSKNIDVKMLASNTKDFEKEKYGISSIPSLLVFNNTKVFKQVDSEEKILKIVRSPSLDLEKTIEAL